MGREIKWTKEEGKEVMAKYMSILEASPDTSMKDLEGVMTPREMDILVFEIKDWYINKRRNG